MGKVMMDASAIIAVIKSEPGADVVTANMQDARISAVNLAEVVTWMTLRGDPLDAIRRTLDMLNLETVDFDGSLAIGTGLLVAQTKRFGLSLGDRACLAAAAREGIPVMTAERSWSNLDAGIAIQTIR